MSTTAEKTILYTLGILPLFVDLNALSGGYYGTVRAKKIPVEWLEGSPFSNFVIPSIILFLFAGGPAFVASIFVFRKI